MPSENETENIPVGETPAVVEEGDGKGSLE